MKKAIGTLFIACILGSTFLSVAGIWGFITGDTVGQLILTCIVVSIGLGSAGTVLDKFYGTGEVYNTVKETVIGKKKPEENTESK